MSIPVMEAHSGAFRSIPVIIRTVSDISRHPQGMHALQISLREKHKVNQLTFPTS